MRQLLLVLLFLNLSLPTQHFISSTLNHPLAKDLTIYYPDTNLSILVVLETTERGKPEEERLFETLITRGEQRSNILCMSDITKNRR